MLDVAVIDDPAAAAITLDPVRSRLLAALTRPGSATTLAHDIDGLTRQKANYHLRALERHGLIELVEERRKGNCTERVMQATAESYVISSDTLPGVAPDTERTRDQLSARWMIALAARLVRDVAVLLARATAARQPLATFAADGEIHFATAADRADFTRDLSQSLEQLASRYHSPGGAGARPHRIVFALHPSITKDHNDNPFKEPTS